MPGTIVRKVDLGEVVIYNVYFYMFMEPVLSLFFGGGTKNNPLKEGPNSNQNKGHLGSRLLVIFSVSPLRFGKVNYWNCRTSQFVGDFICNCNPLGTGIPFVGIILP